MSRRAGVLIVVTLVVAGCGSHQTASRRTTTAATATTASGSATTSMSAPPPKTTPASSPSPSTRGSEPPIQTAPTPSSAAPAGGAGSARLPANFTIGAGDRLSPPAITAPAFVAVELTLISGDGRAHRAVVHTRPQRTLVVPAHGRAVVELPGARSGTIAISIDGGRGQGSLSFGGEPGP